MAVDYKKYDFRVFENLVTVQTELSRFNSLPSVRELVEQVEQLKIGVKSKKIRVAVVGEFNRGKTTLINAVLGSEILPADVRPTTAAINRITYGSTPHAYINFTDGSSMETDICELSNHITKLTDKSLETALAVKEAVVEFPSIICNNYVDIIDTPGMNDDDSMCGVTLGQLANIDIAVAALCAGIPCSDTESRFIAKLVESEEISDIVIVITQIDKVRESDRCRIKSVITERVKEKVMAVLRESYGEKDSVMEKYHRIFDEPKVFAVSALNALDALRTNDSALFEESGMGELNDKLPQIILSNRSNNAVFDTAKNMKHIAEKYKDVYLQITDRQAMRGDLDNARANMIGIINSFESNMSNFSGSEIDSRLPKPAQNISEMFEGCTDMKKLKSLKVRRRVKRRKRRVMKFINNFINYFFWRDITESVTKSIKASLDIMYGKVSSEASRFAETDGIKDIIREIKVSSDISNTADRPRFVCKWTRSPVPPFKVCRAGKDKITEHIYEAVLASLSITGGEMREQIDKAIRKNIIPEIKKNIIESLRKKINEYFTNLNSEFENTYNERVKSAEIIEEIFEKAAADLENISRELKGELAVKLSQ